MPIKAILDNLEGLSDELKALYKPIREGANAGKFLLDVESIGGFSLENVDGLKNAYAATKQELDTAKQALEGYKGLPAAREVRQKLKKLEDLEKIDPTAEADRLAAAKAESQIAELTRQHETEVKSRDKRIEHLTATLESVLVDQQLDAAIVKHKGIPELLRPMLRPRVKVVEKDGEFETKVVDAKGQQEYVIRDNKPVPATIEDLVAKTKADPLFGRAFEASGRSGSGAESGERGGAGGAANPWLRATFNLTEQMRLLKSDPSLAAALKAQAGVVD